MGTYYRILPTIRWQELATVFAVEKPNHMDGSATLSVQFYDRAGTAAIKVFVVFAGPVEPERAKRFGEIRERFRDGLVA